MASVRGEYQFCGSLDNACIKFSMVARRSHLRWNKHPIVLSESRSLLLRCPLYMILYDIYIYMYSLFIVMTRGRDHAASCALKRHPSHCMTWWLEWWYEWCPLLTMHFYASLTSTLMYQKQSIHWKWFHWQNYSRTPPLKWLVNHVNPYVSGNKNENPHMSISEYHWS